MLLSLKSIYQSDNIYSFTGTEIKGFQFNDPNNDKIVTVIFFFENDNGNQIEFFSMSQDEIDFVLSTITNVQNKL